MKNTPETLTLTEAKQLCGRLHDLHQQLLHELAPCGPIGSYFIDNFSDCLRVMEMHSRRIAEIRVELEKRKADIATKQAIIEIARKHLP